MTVNAELAAAIRRVNALWMQVPPRFQPPVDSAAWRRLERQIDRCLAAGDRDGALEAIERWEEHAKTIIAPALANAPLTDREAA